MFSNLLKRTPLHNGNLRFISILSSSSAQTFRIVYFIQDYGQILRLSKVEYNNNIWRKVFNLNSSFCCLSEYLFKHHQILLLFKAKEEFVHRWYTKVKLSRGLLNADRRVRSLKSFQEPHRESTSFLVVQCLDQLLHRSPQMV